MRKVLGSAFAALGVLAAGGAAGSVTFYEGENFTGREFAADRTVANFEDVGFNDRARSAIVKDGRWEICADANFGGGCSILGPGRYPALKGFAGKVSSVREVSGAGMPARAGMRKPVDSRVTLYEGRNFSGRSYTVELGSPIANLDGTGFNDRASSMRVPGGYWIFCSDANFGGECRTFGPGEHATLPAELDRTISSGRRISEVYPYTQAPRWQR